MARQAIQTDQAPAAIGPYSQAVRAGALLFISGQIPLDPVSGRVVDGNTAAQTHRVMESIGAILQAAGAGYEHVVRATIFLVDIQTGPRPEPHANATRGPDSPTPRPRGAHVRACARGAHSQTGCPPGLGFPGEAFV